jgi:ribosomal protein RSM22 (predicted rRNA methylase)
VEVDRVDPKALGQAATELSEAYRARRPIGRDYIVSDTHRLAYVAVRLPATYVAARAALAQLASAISSETISSLLGLGSGPGTASWAAIDTFSELTDITLIERDRGLIDLGRTLAQSSGSSLLQTANWECADLTASPTLRSNDLVVCSYTLGELDVQAARQLIETAWLVARIALVIVEPGTVPGFNAIREFRDQLIGLGAHIVAPCPHANDCPISGDDWCHFSQRLNRSALHRRLKTGSMGHEDEKFSYIVVSRHPVETSAARVIRHPQRRSGHAHLSLCTREGLQEKTVTRSAKADWKRARKLSWGDAW